MRLRFCCTMDSSRAVLQDAPRFANIGHGICKNGGGTFEAILLPKRRSNGFLWRKKRPMEKWPVSSWKWILSAT